jgi:protein-S-isoprenylcysteine O-methyltransferase Ste14
MEARDVSADRRGSDFATGGGKAIAALSYLLIALALIATVLTLAAAANGSTGPAIAAGITAVVLALVGGLMWFWQAKKKTATHADSSDRAESSEGRGPLGI